ncbi:competence/damage-inducible protein A [Mahella sp.]|uniref:competence/damage-inducible protein A n=1 Tax=Mahella sp. TaxID=2798721 RepID=UPI0025C00E10|nr:competence/damage-inducible protein A [Mahella sp.]MBZ4666550.1 competence/damage-inducible protein cinA [Mahella sp.]
MDCEIISVGTELLLGQIANTDAQYISQRLSELGINVYYHTVVGDNRQRLLNALDVAVKRADLIITTGGLGPTVDDLTKETVAEFLGLELQMHEPSLQYIKEYFNRTGRQVSDNNIKQALLPKGSIPIPNPNGTAPGVIIEHEKGIFVILPGPPMELQPMFEETAVPFLQKFSDYAIVSRVLRIFGIGESKVEEMVEDLLDEQDNPTIAPLVGHGDVTLRITARVRKGEDAYALISPVERQIKQRLGDAVYGVDDDTLSKVVGRMLIERELKLALAESCTGGLISDKLTDIPGISTAFDRGLVTYSNEAKMELLGVSNDTLNRFGAVSPQTAEEMALGALAHSHADIALAVTGIAGPDGGTPSKPVGLVYMAIADSYGAYSSKHVFGGNRRRIKETAALTALNLLRLHLLKNND